MMKREDKGAEKFAPPLQENRAPRDGKRREATANTCVALRWPETSRARFELFDAWHEIAAQVLHRDGQSFRLLAVIERFLNWQSGDFWPSNETLARRAGGCGTSTIKRDLRAYARLGLILVDLSSRRGATGQIVRKRTIRLAIPDEFKGNFEDIEGAMRGPHGVGDQGAMRGPPEGVMRGPYNTDTPEGRELEDRQCK